MEEWLESDRSQPKMMKKSYKVWEHSYKVKLLRLQAKILGGDRGWAELEDRLKGQTRSDKALIG